MSDVIASPDAGLDLDRPLGAADAQVAELVDAEVRRQHETVRLIASENYASRAVMEATGTVLTNKYSEGYAGKRYYEGQQVIDQVETLAIERAKSLFGVEHANVQPYSGSPANLAIYLAFLAPGEYSIDVKVASATGTARQLVRFRLVG